MTMTKSDAFRLKVLDLLYTLEHKYSDAVSVSKEIEKLAKETFLETNLSTYDWFEKEPRR